MTRTRSWLIPAGLLLLTAIPGIAGAVRLTQLAAGGPVTPANSRFFASPIPIWIHIVGATVYCVLGAFQFAPRFRRRHIRWHRWAGRILVPAGLAAAFTGMWMATGKDLPPADGAVLETVRLLVGAAMATSLVLAVVTVRRGDIAAHRAWMIRAYALGQGAGTQVFTQTPWTLAFGEPTTIPRATLMTLGWAINILLAEYLIRRASPTLAPRAVTGSA